jgi:hypothetical protein
MRGEPGFEEEGRVRLGRKRTLIRPSVTFSRSTREKDLECVGLARRQPATDNRQPADY